ncbi:MAG: hypothetical protein KAI69_05725 [Deltaproteobacteria bacterium]|nr:hypothetical protein [Deltaproteobacteria bacterium]
MLLLSFTCLFMFSAAASAFALDLEISVSSGYDDNPRLEKGSEGAAFTETEVDMWQTWPLPNYPTTSITLLSFAGYQLYDGLDDNWQLGGGVITSTQLPELSCRLEFSGDLTAYRNPLVDDNEFDNLSLGSRLVWFAGSRLHLEFETNLSFEDYCRTVSSGNHGENCSDSVNNDAGKGNGRPENQQHPHAPHNNKQPQYHNSGDRSDQLFATALKAYYAFAPYLDGGSELFWRHRHSSIDAEKRSAYGLGVNLNWHPTATLEFIWALSGERLPYKYDYKKKERTEKIYTAKIIAAWHRGSWTISGTWDWSKRDSVINEDDYRHNLWQGRLTYSY